LARVLADDAPVATAVEGLIGAVKVDPLKVIKDDPANDPLLLY
jgi:hypothetical protein